MVSDNLIIPLDCASMFEYRIGRGVQHVKPRIENWS